MKIVIYSDIQGIRLELPELKPDLVVLQGDIEWDDVKKIDEHFKGEREAPIVGVLGNHDRWDTFVRTNVIDIHGKVVEIGGISIAGFGGSPTYNHKKNTPQFEEGDVYEFTRKLGYTDIFVAHSNPAYGSVMNSREAHRGFSSFREYMERSEPSYFLHGHIHENEIFEYKKTTVIVTLGMRIIEIS